MAEQLTDYTDTGYREIAVGASNDSRPSALEGPHEPHPFYVTIITRPVSVPTSSRA